MKKIIIQGIIVLTIAICAPTIYNVVMDSFKGHGIPVTTVKFGQNRILMLYLNRKTSNWKMILHDYKAKTSENISDNSVLTKCIPIYYNDSILVSSYDMEGKDKYVFYNINTKASTWANEDEFVKIMPFTNLISYQSNLDQNNYDPEKLPDYLISDEGFRAAQHLKTNNGIPVSYKGKDVIVIFSHKFFKEPVNKYSRFNYWKLTDVIKRKAYLCLYDANTKTFDWVSEQNINNKMYYQMTLFNGVFQLNKEKILLVNNTVTEILNLKDGKIVVNSEI